MREFIRNHTLLCLMLLAGIWGLAAYNLRHVTEGRERLVAAFDVINDNVKSLFEALFGGGQAELKLVESDDPLEAGLEIFAQLAATSSTVASAPPRNTAGVS